MNLGDTIQPLTRSQENPNGKQVLLSLSKMPVTPVSQSDSQLEQHRTQNTECRTL